MEMFNFDAINEVYRRVEENAEQVRKVHEKRNDRDIILEKLERLITTVEFGDKVNEANLSLIETELEKIKVNTYDLQKEFVSIAKEKLAEKGVEYTIMFILQGLKNLYLQS